MTTLGPEGLAPRLPGDHLLDVGGGHGPAVPVPPDVSCRPGPRGHAVQGDGAPPHHLHYNCQARLGLTV